VNQIIHLFFQEISNLKNTATTRENGRMQSSQQFLTLLTNYKLAFNVQKRELYLFFVYQLHKNVSILDKIIETVGLL
jgi:hypothetical protein